MKRHAPRPDALPALEPLCRTRGRARAARVVWRDWTCQRCADWLERFPSLRARLREARQLGLFDRR